MTSYVEEEVIKGSSGGRKGEEGYGGSAAFTTQAIKRGRGEGGSA